MSGISLQNVLDYSSQLLGESGGTPTSQISIRTNFANRAKDGISRIRHWSWELKTGDAISYVYSSSPTNGVYTYALAPSAGTFKNKNSMLSLTFTQNGTVTPFSQVPESQMNYEVINQLTDNIFYIQGNDVDGYTLVINSYAMALPTTNVSNAWNYRYYAKEPDFVNTTDTIAIPSVAVIAWRMASAVLYGYREQAQAQIADQQAQDALDDLAMEDQKESPFTDVSIMSLRTYRGASNSYKSYY